MQRLDSLQQTGSFGKKQLRPHESEFAGSRSLCPSFGDMDILMVVFNVNTSPITEELVLGSNTMINVDKGS